MNAIETLDNKSKNSKTPNELAEYTKIHSLDLIPQKLKEKNQWVLWKPKYRPDKDKVDKIPVNPRTYKNASSTNQATWATFDAAVKALKLGYGLGFVLIADDGLIGIDIDNCVNEGAMEPWAKEIINALNSYTELSPSRSGIRIFVQADWPAGGNRKGQLEVYAQGRFLTVTGSHLEGTSLDLECRQEAIDLLHSHYFSKEKVVEIPLQPSVITLSESDLVQIAKKSKQGAVFTRLLEGDWQGLYASHSQADQAFCNMLAFWTGKNEAQMDSFVRNSGLYRDKWDEMHGSQPYGQMTIAKAIADTRNVFQPKTITFSRRDPQDDFTKPAYFDEQGTFIPAWLAKDILNECHIKYAAGEIWIYDNGVYRSGGERILEKLAQDKLGDATRTGRIKETLDYIKRDTYSDLPRPQSTFINVNNGRLNWRTGILEPHNPNIFEIVQLAVTYDARATCPVFDKYLETTLEPDVIPLVEEIMGYCLIPNTKYEKAVMCTGAGRNGKSIFLFIIQTLLGHENISNVALQELEENKFRAAELLGKLANVFADLDARALKGSSFFKMLVSGDTLTAERKFRDPFTFSNYARLIFSTNKLPRSSDNTFAFYERWLLIPFEKTFDAKNPATDPNLRVKLSTPDELAGILNRALKGLRTLWHTGRFTEPASVKAALNEYRRQNDSVMAFCEDCVELAAHHNLSKQELYSSYKLWCENQGLSPISQTKLKPSLFQVFPQVCEGRDGRRGPRVWVGIKLSEEAP